MRGFLGEKVSEEKQKWNLSFTEEDFHDAAPDNYKSAEESSADRRRHVMQEAELGSIIRMKADEAKKKYQGRLAIAALGAVPKELGSTVVRIARDGSDSGGVNHRIKVRNRLRFPAVDDASGVLQHAEDEVEEAGGTVRFSMLYDVLAHNASGLELGILHLLFAEDGWMLALGAYFWRRLLFWLFVLDICEAPLSRKKVRGGTVVQWIGCQINVGSFEKGSTEKKVRWMLEGLEKHEASGGVLGRDLKSALGRFGFVAGALQHVRPFLGPIFAWSARLAPATYAKFPDAIRVLLQYVMKQVAGCPMAKPKRTRDHVREAFRADAKAEGAVIVIGGWEVLEGKEKRYGRWFSIELNRRNAPWAHLKGKRSET
eukprot:s2362_g3.t1